MRFMQNVAKIPCKRCGEVHPYFTRECIPIVHGDKVGKKHTWGDIFPNGKWVDVT